MKHNYSEVIVQPSIFQRVFNILGLTSILIMIMVLFSFWGALGEEVPIHFNIRGQADGYGSKYILLILPIISLGLFILLSFLEKRPQAYNYVVKITEQNAQKQYELAVVFLNVTKNLCVMLLTFVALFSILEASGLEGRGLNSCIVIFGALIAMALIIYLMQSIKHK